MVEVPDALRCLFSAPLEQRGDTYVVEVPRSEVERNGVTPGTAYRIAMLAQTDRGEAESAPRSNGTPERAGRERSRQPPVDEGDVRQVTIETTGDQGDGIAKVDRGYVLIVPDADPGDEVTVEVEKVHENFAIAPLTDD